jgi:restriction system protein
MTSTKKTSPRQALAAKIIYAGLSILRDNGKELPIRDLMEKVEKAVGVDEWAKERYEKTGYVRWESIFHLRRLPLCRRHNARADTINDPLVLQILF